MDKDERRILNEWLMEQHQERASSDEEILLRQFSAEARSLREERQREIQELQQDFGVPGGRISHPRQRFVSRLEFRRAIEREIDRQFAELTPSEFEGIVDAWVRAMHYDLSRARQWWKAGVSPLNNTIVAIVNSGLTPEDLSARVNGITIVQHLSRGDPPRWCFDALQWQRRRDKAVRRYPAS